MIFPEKIRVLIVEDNPVNARVAFFQLRQLGFESEIVENGQQAIEALSARKYDLVLMDLQMPVMDGIAATSAIREGRAGENKDIPIIALTANDELKKECLEAGCNFLLTKPAAMDDLSKIIRECLQAKRR